jgi:hypothetical protein
LEGFCVYARGKDVYTYDFVFGVLGVEFDFEGEVVEKKIFVFTEGSDGNAGVKYVAITIF